MEARKTTGAQDSPEILSDVTPDNDWIPWADYAARVKGHHNLPQSQYREMPPETRKVFDEATSGKLFVGRIDGRRHEYDGIHRQYNDATRDLLELYMEGWGIAEHPELMTPDHARAILKAIAESQDPRILVYRNFIRLMRTLPHLRAGGRGME
jgi:hypothetical protein